MTWFGERPRLRSTWRHPSIKRLVEESGDSDLPEAIIRRRARETLRHGRGVGWSGPPFDPEILAGILGIRLCEGPPNLPVNALIRPLTEEIFEIVIHPSLPRGRRNFSIFHEIAHTFFPDCAAVVRHRARDRPRFDPDKEVEDLCDIAASELLLPDEEFVADLGVHGVSIETIDLLRERYHASREATAIRLSQLSNDPCAVAFVSLRLKPVEKRADGQSSFAFAPRPAPKLRVDFMSSSKTFRGPRMPKHKSIPDTSKLYELLDRPAEGSPQTRDIDSEEAWDTGKARMPASRIEASLIPSSDEGSARLMVLFIQDAG